MTKPRPLPYATFLQSFRLCPRLAISLCVVDPRGKIILAKRGIPPKKGSWHLPGSFLLKDESLHDCIARILRDECGLRLTRAHRVTFLGPFENLTGDPRGHVVDLVYIIRLTPKDTPRPGQGTAALIAYDVLPTGMQFGHDRIVQAWRKKERDTHVSP